MTLYAVIKTLYNGNNNLYDDFGRSVNCLSELVGVFGYDEAYAVQERLYNKSKYEIVPWEDGDELDPEETYIDVVVQEVEIDVNVATARQKGG